MKFSEVIARTVALADAYRDRSPRPAGKGRVRFRPIPLSQLPPGPSPEWNELVGFLRGQPPALLDRMAALMLVGRGDCDPADFEEVFAQLADLRHPSEATATYLAGKVPLGQYLRDGVRELTAAGVDVDESAVSRTPSGVS